jgi:hypothetical protein
MQRLALAMCAAILMISWSAAVTTQAPPSPDQIVTALKQNLAESKTRLRQYEWIETTAISLKGEEKSRKQQRAYYGADGTLVKVPLGPAPAPAPPPQATGRRGGRVKARVIENKKEDMQEYMQQALALIHKYVPPDAALVQKAKDAGLMKVGPAQPGIVRAEFTDFVQPADSMKIDIDAKALLLSAVTVATYLEKPEDAVTLDVRFASLADGTGYAARTTLNATAKNIQVVVENTGHRPMAAQ